MTTDRDAAPWFKALGQGQILMQRCDECGAWRWPPRAMCNRCASLGNEWKRILGRGKVASWFVNHHRFSPAFDLPYAVVLVRLDEQDDLLIPGPFAGELSELRIGLSLYGEVSVGTEAKELDSDSQRFLVWSVVSEDLNQ
jgi:uncharacterized OB-fold protein